ncbi:hypothetical protein L2725_08735 [Shewanella corallii]|uniref:CHAD domain-containing protein n=1 Tax=Shewanella corallii TaxID=560080 RepID=A0ABT0N604_9GAMM|nr:hypothetical protein [Shewanella corallii]MCL2913878.1 hypothetical protein [Shewanella corallii]
MVGILSRTLVSLLLLMLLTACGGGIGDDIDTYQSLVKERLATLSTQMNDGQVRNASLLKQYGQLLGQEQPQYAMLAEEIAKDATTEGPMYQSLKRRYQDSLNPANYLNQDEQLAELENLYQATDPALFNDMLSDPLNVLADMSGGTLARVNAMSREAQTLANGAEDFGAGSQLVGNPAYGQWQTNSSGMSFWAWYGMYSLFSDLFDRRVYYGDWSRKRGYSYYNDIGRYRYSSPKQIKRQESVFRDQQKRYKNQGKPFSSPYAKTRSGASGLSRQSAQAPSPSSAPKASQRKFRSNYAKSSSHRNSSGRTSRSVSRGK